jgi:hypothetical protein
VGSSSGIRLCPLTERWKKILVHYVTPLCMTNQALKFLYQRRHVFVFIYISGLGHFERTLEKKLKKQNSAPHRLLLHEQNTTVISNFGIWKEWKIFTEKMDLMCGRVK